VHFLWGGKRRRSAKKRKEAQKVTKESSRITGNLEPSRIIRKEKRDWIYAQPQLQTPAFTGILKHLCSENIANA
jgi:hypothetical protein